jgi:cytoskeletal protein RodZ
MFEIGSSLRDARTRQGLDLLDLESETKIRAKYLRALEEERFDLLPGEAYTKGFLRTYAERLGLDGQLYVDEYNSRFSEAAEPLFSARPRQRAHRRLESHAVLIALAGIVIVTVLVIAAWQLGDSSSSKDRDSIPPSAPAPSTSVETETSSDVPTNAPAASAGTSLVITATGSVSHIEVRRGSAHGGLLFAGPASPSFTHAFGEAKRYWIQASDLANLVLTVDDIRYDDLGGPGAATVLVTVDGPRIVSSP